MDYFFRNLQWQKATIGVCGVWLTDSWPIHITSGARLGMARELFKMCRVQPISGRELYLLCARRQNVLSEGLCQVKFPTPLRHYHWFVVMCNFTIYRNKIVFQLVNFLMFWFLFNNPLCVNVALPWSSETSDIRS